MTALPDHGGGLSNAVKRWPNFRGAWLDLSTGINPWPYPIPSLPQDIWHRLPDQNLDVALRSAAAKHYGALDSTNILATPGSGSFIRTFPLTLPPKTVAILGPTYSEHAASWAAAGHSIRQVATLEQTENADVVIVVNPNNPDGRVLTPETLVNFAQSNPSRLLVVDQAFCDLSPNLSIISTRPENCVVLASFGKVFGLAGLRLGLAFGSLQVLAPVSTRLGPWPVSGPALFIGEQALRDQEWIAETRLKLSAQTQKLDHILRSRGLEIAGGTLLFRLVRHKNAHALWNLLGQNGILTRAFSYDTTWLRIGMPMDEPALNRLADCLANRSP